MPSYNSTARMPFKRGGSVKKSSSEFSSYNKIRDHIDREQKLQRRKEEMEMDRRKINQKKQGVMVAKGGPIKKPKVKRIILWKGKAKDWPGAKEAARQTRNKKAKGGKADKNWIQDVNKSIKKRGTKGVCTGKKFGSASCKPGSKRYNLAKTFKKMARAKHASGGLVRYI